jgi:hypothetical protein
VIVLVGCYNNASVFAPADSGRAQPYPKHYHNGMYSWIPAALHIIALEASVPAYRAQLQAVSRIQAGRQYGNSQTRQLQK